jgi:hypothetical protein
LGIEFVEVGDDYIVGRVPVDERTRQPYGLLHGGVSVVLAETLGSCGAAFSCPPDHRAVGLDINANHLKGVKSGWVTGTRLKPSQPLSSIQRSSSSATVCGLPTTLGITLPSDMYSPISCTVHSRSASISAK